MVTWPTRRTQNTRNHPASPTGPEPKWAKCAWVHGGSQESVQKKYCIFPTGEQVFEGFLPLFSEPFLLSTKNGPGHTHLNTGSDKNKACLNVVGRVTTWVWEFIVLIWTFHLKCYVVCLNVMLLCYRITCLWFCNKRFCNNKGALFVPDPVYKIWPNI